MKLFKCSLQAVSFQLTSFGTMAGWMIVGPESESPEPQTYFICGLYADKLANVHISTNWTGFTVNILRKWYTTFIILLRIFPRVNCEIVFVGFVTSVSNFAVSPVSQFSLGARLHMGYAVPGFSRSWFSGKMHSCLCQGSLVWYVRVFLCMDLSATHPSWRMDILFGISLTYGHKHVDILKQTHLNPVSILGRLQEP